VIQFETMSLSQFILLLLLLVQLQVCCMAGDSRGVVKRDEPLARSQA